MDAREFSGAIRKAEFAGNHLFGEVAFADEERHDKDARSEGGAQNRGDARFLFPEGFKYIGENAAAAQFIGVLVGRFGRFGIQRRAVADENESGVLVVLLHQS